MHAGILDSELQSVAARFQADAGPETDPVETPPERVRIGKWIAGHRILPDQEERPDQQRNRSDAQDTPPDPCISAP